MFCFVLVKDGDSMQNIDTQNCLHLWSRYAAITSVAFFVFFLFGPLEWVND